jgi:hypothetical protein
VQVEWSGLEPRRGAGEPRPAIVIGERSTDRKADCERGKRSGTEKVSAIDVTRHGVLFVWMGVL